MKVERVFYDFPVGRLKDPMDKASITGQLVDLVDTFGLKGYPVPSGDDSTGDTFRIEVTSPDQDEIVRNVINHSDPGWPSLVDAFARIFKAPVTRQVVREDQIQAPADNSGEQ